MSEQQPGEQVRDPEKILVDHEARLRYIEDYFLPRRWAIGVESEVSAGVLREVKEGPIRTWVIDDPDAARAAAPAYDEDTVLRLARIAQAVASDGLCEHAVWDLGEEIVEDARKLADEQGWEVAE